MKDTKHLHALKIGTGAAGLLALAAILVAANVVIGNLRALKWDATEEKLYTLSDGTRDILGRLDRNVKIMFFFNRSAAEVPAPLKTFADRVEDLLREFAAAAKGRIVVETYDPKPLSEAEDLAIEKGIAGQPLGVGGPKLYIGLAIAAGDKESVIPALMPSMEGQLEYEIARQIYQAAKEKKPVVAVLSSLPVLGTRGQPFVMPGQPRPPTQPAWASFRGLREQYDVRELNAAELESIDADVDALVLVHPKELSETAQFAIDQFVLRGGRLLAFLDPSCLVEQRYGPSQNPYGMNFGPGSDLGKLLPAWGVTLEGGKAVSDPVAKTAVRSGNSIRENATWLSLRGGAGGGADITNISPSDNVTAKLELMLMPVAGSFSGSGAEGLELTPLLTSSPKASLVDAMMARFGGESSDKTPGAGMKKLNLAVKLYGEFKTAFPDGKPKKEEKDADKKDAAAKEDKPAPGDSLKKSKEKSTVILVADADMLDDQFCVAEVGALQMFGISAFQPINDNINFFANSLEMLTGDTALSKVRARGKTDRPFTRVQELEAQAGDKWQVEAAQLQKDLEATQKELAQLQTQKDASQKYVLSPEQQDAIKRFRQKEVDTRRQLKEVEKRLHEDKERLGLVLKILNVGVMPLLVCMAGLGFALYRHNKGRA